MLTTIGTIQVTPEGQKLYSFIPLSHNETYLHYKFLVNVLLCYTRLELRWFQKPQEKFVNNLKVEKQRENVMLFSIDSHTVLFSCKLSCYFISYLEWWVKAVNFQTKLYVKTIRPIIKINSNNLNNDHNNHCIRYEKIHPHIRKWRKIWSMHVVVHKHNFDITSLTEGELLLRRYISRIHFHFGQNKI